MGATFAVIWEALHEADARFAGAQLCGERGLVALHYHGKATRTGFLAWQKNRMEAPAEVQLVRYRSDDVVWGAEWGAALPWESLSGEQTRRALEVTPFAVAARSVVFRHTWEDDRQVVVALDAESGATRWWRVAVEPDASAVSVIAGFVLLRDGRQAPQVVDLDTGEVRARLNGVAPDADIAAGGGLILALEQDGLMHCFSPDGGKLWTAKTPGLLHGSLAEGVAMSGAQLLVAEPGRLRALGAADGKAQWEASAPAGPKLVVQAQRGVVAVEDATHNDIALYWGERGRPVLLPDEVRCLHWCAFREQVALTSFDGGLLWLGTQGEVRWQAPAGSLRYIDTASAGDRLFATAVQVEEGSMLLQELDPSQIRVVRELQVPELGEISLHLLNANEVALISEGRGLIVAKAG